MKAESITVGEALDRGAALPWALVRGLSAVSLGPSPARIDPDELMEARFFSPEEEIRVFRTDGQLRAVQLRGEPGDSVIERVYAVENPKLGKSVTVSYTLEADEDGQVNLTSTRLTGWEGTR